MVANQTYWLLNMNSIGHTHPVLAFTSRGFISVLINSDVEAEAEAEGQEAYLLGRKLKWKRLKSTSSASNPQH